jgi:alanyl-tRNA synthetase
MQKEIIEMLKVEEEKFQDTLIRGEGMVKRIAAELKAKGTAKIPENTLSELYDSHGLPPEIVKQAAEKEGVQVEVPENFYALIANRHMAASKSAEEEEAQAEKMLQKAVEKLPATETLYYTDTYLREFDAKVLKIINGIYVVLDQSCFYPEGGGQLADQGWITAGNAKYNVIDVQKIGKVIVHKLGEAPTFKEGSVVHGVLDWDRRHSLMKAHTVTHLINGAARRVLGEHVWQSGTQKGLETSRLDITHYRRLTQEEIHKIEQLANQAIAADMKVTIKWYPRNEAESLYGFRLYQGGAVPGKDIRVVKTGDWDVEACAGTHLRSTLEVGYVKIVYTERVQDGVERLGYAVGLEAVKAVQKQENMLWKISEVLTAPVDKLDKTAEKLVKELKETTLEKRKLIKELAAKESAAGQAHDAEASLQVNGVAIVKRNFGDIIDVDRMVQTATEIIKRTPLAVTLFYGSDGKTCRLMVMAGDEAVKKGVNAGNVVKESAPVFGGGGGGRINFAQGGGTKPDRMADAVKTAEDIVKKQLEH